jgi:hypothetical protein
VGFGVILENKRQILSKSGVGKQTSKPESTDYYDFDMNGKPKRNRSIGRGINYAKMIGYSQRRIKKYFLNNFVH